MSARPIAAHTSITAAPSLERETKRLGRNKDRGHRVAIVLERRGARSNPIPRCNMSAITVLVLSSLAHPSVQARVPVVQSKPVAVSDDADADSPEHRRERQRLAVEFDTKRNPKLGAVETEQL